MEKTFLLTIIFAISFVPSFSQTRLTPHRVTLADGRSFSLNLPANFDIAVAAQGLKRIRFMAKSPDNRIFVTDMFNLEDNKRGAVYILDDFDTTTKRFNKVTQFMNGLRNPNSVAFYTDNSGTQWFYLALTDQLVRYKYQAGSVKPTGDPEVLATYPDYGLSYKYGGWHLTRTIVFGNGKLYVSVGSSCNACEEKEDVRASIMEMDPDGKNQRHFARGLRNAVGMRWIDNQLVVTNMGADHLGLDRPADTMGTIRAGTNYGWPYCFQNGSKMFVDQKYNPRGSKFDCKQSPPLRVPFTAHAAPLGLEYFDDTNGSELSRSFLVALHGSTNKRIAHGYSVVRVADGSTSTEDFITGFLQRGVVNGRPCDIFAFGKNAFLLTDDKSGVIYFVYKKS